MPKNIICPEGFELIENIVLPRNVTHANRKIPKIVHVTGKSRCLPPGLKKDVLSWVFPGYGLCFHDDDAVWKFMRYIIDDSHGYELVMNLRKTLLCAKKFAMVADLWRYALLYWYGGVYVDLDNIPGPKYDPEFITPETDSFFLRESYGIMTQFYMASSKHHPILLNFLSVSLKNVYASDGNVVNVQLPKKTGPGAVKLGYITFQAAMNITTNGYDPAGVYHGGVGADLLLRLPWYKKFADGAGENSEAGLLDGREYPLKSQLVNRTVTIGGETGKAANRYISNTRYKMWSQMNMTHYRKGQNAMKKINRISCAQHVNRMEILTTDNTSFYYNKLRLPGVIIARYEFSQDLKGYVDPNSGNETLRPWSKQEVSSFNERERQIMADLALDHKEQLDDMAATLKKSVYYGAV